ncbi:hypothetical protein SSX86_020641 [Deinandra increscens subsp. villosa]|uniref:Receptor-like serine/threonine-protein kinase n=1 Tax=Deinandra increscens subsp. villosa TaxID=3103831 RepID=A0AAP0GTF1_9ASTR
MKAPWLTYCFLFLNCYSTIAQPPSSNTTVDLSTTWSNNKSLPNSFTYFDVDKTTVRVILFRGPLDEPLIGVMGEVLYTPTPRFACGFYCNGNCTSFLFAVFIVKREFDGGSFYPQVVWSANRDHPVSDGAILNLTTTGELVLQDVDGSTVWTTNTTGKSVTGLNLTDDGNLVLFDINNSTVWQSFDNPTDCLVLGQALISGQQLIPSVSSTNWTAQKDLFSLQVIPNQGLFAYVGSNPPQEYFSINISFYNSNDKGIGKSNVTFLNGSLSIFIFSQMYADKEIAIPQASSAQYMKLMPDGHLRVFEWLQDDWLVVADLFTEENGLNVCDYPMACGRYGICSGNQQCSCLVSSSSRLEYFRAENDRQPNLGCSEITPLACNATQDQVFIQIENVSYFLSLPNMESYFRSLPNMESVDVETCKQACANNCLCKAALFGYYYSDSSGDCVLLSEVLTMINFDVDRTNPTNSSAFLKVQNVRPTPLVLYGPFSPSSSKSRSTLGVIVASSIASVVFLLGTIGFVIYLIRKRRWATQMEEEYIDESLEMPTRFSYEELKPATENFNKKLGEGGFGAVYEGNLEDGSKIAVKCLQGLGQVNKSFLAEVKSIGSIHHVNLVRLRGFCAWKSQRFLVYEFMCNGSLDRWIYHGDRKHVLEWKCRKKIILDVAKGLAYLHEECRQKIIHLDIKPQNILLDSDFNAKVSDFGLSKLIDRDQTHVMTTMRGTPGYMAPEWLSLVITEKVDVYSFGIVLLKMLCGRKIFDRSQPKESWHLLAVLQKCWEQGMLVNMVDEYSEDMQTHATEVVEMIKVASWCLQCDFTKRPSMSTVVKVLEGTTKVDSSLDYNFTNPRLQHKPVEHEKDITQLMASAISGPR